MSLEIIFPLVDKVTSVTANLSHGVTPSAIRLDIPKQSQPVEGTGDLTIRFEGQEIVFRDCLVDRSTGTDSSSGQIDSIMLFDRRWRWQFQEDSFVFNVRNGLDEIRVPPPLAALQAEGRTAQEIEFIQLFYDTRRTARELGDWILFTMGEFDVRANQLPNEPLPELGDEAVRPASTLARLLDLFQCGIGLDHKTNQVGIYRLGDGRELPTDLPIIRQSAAGAGGVRPEKVRVITKPILYQWDFRLEPVAEEVDGNFVPIEDVSYKPDGGWIKYVSAIKGFVDLDAADATNKKVKKLADQSVYRSWRPVWRGGNTPSTTAAVQLDGVPIFIYDQIAPFKNRLVQDVIKQGAKRPHEAIVYGQYYDFEKYNQNVIDADFAVPPLTDPLDSESVVDAPWTVYSDAGVVQFSQPMLLQQTDLTMTPADLFLRIAFYVRNGLNRAHWRREVDRAIPPPVTAGVISHQVLEDLEPKAWYAFAQVNPSQGASGPIIAGQQQDNFDEITQRAQPYLEAMQRRVEKGTRPRSVVYAGLVDSIRLDGAIRSITWSANLSGVSTFVQRNQDLGSAVTLPFNEVRRIELEAQRTRENDRVPTERLKVDRDERAKQQQ